MNLFYAQELFGRSDGVFNWIILQSCKQFAIENKFYTLQITALLFMSKNKIKL